MVQVSVSPIDLSTAVQYVPNFRFTLVPTLFFPTYETIIFPLRSRVSRIDLIKLSFIYVLTHWAENGDKPKNQRGNEAGNL